MKYCTNCGTKQIASSKFCGNCGNKIEEKSTKEFIQETSEDSKEIKTDEIWNKLKIDEKQIEILSDFGTGPGIMDWDDDLSEFSFPNHIQKIMDCFCLTRDEIEELEKLSSDKRGVIKYPNKEIYIGELSNGFRNGFGVYFVNEVEANQIIIDDSKDEDNFIMTYNGFWVDDKRSGKGFEVNEVYRTLTYKGDWDNDLYNGKGIKYGTKKAKEIGNYKNGSRHGKGKWLFEDGGVGFEGDFKDDEKHGFGVEFNEFTKKKNFEGKWEFDKFIEGNIYNSDGVIVFTGKYDDEDGVSSLDLDGVAFASAIEAFGGTNFSPDLSRFVDNETTFLGHINITNTLENEINISAKSYLNENLENTFNEKDRNNVLEFADIKYHFMYHHDSTFLIVFSYEDQIYNFVMGRDLRWCFSWDDDTSLAVSKEKKGYAIIKILGLDPEELYDDVEDMMEYMDEDELAELEIRLKRPKSGLFNTPWKFKFTDIVNAINDAQKEFGYSRV